MSKQYYYSTAHDSEVMRGKLKEIREVTRKIEAKVVTFQNCNIETNKNLLTIEQYNEILRAIESRTSMLNYFCKNLEIELEQFSRLKAILLAKNVT